MCVLAQDPDSPCRVDKEAFRNLMIHRQASRDLMFLICRWLDESLVQDGESHFAV